MPKKWSNILLWSIGSWMILYIHTFVIFFTFFTLKLDVGLCNNCIYNIMYVGKKCKMHCRFKQSTTTFTSPIMSTSIDAPPLNNPPHHYYPHAPNVAAYTKNTYIETGTGTTPPLSHSHPSSLHSTDNY